MRNKNTTARSARLSTAFKDGLKAGLKLTESLEYIDKMNAMEGELRTAVPSRAVIAWRSTIKGVEAHQVHTAEKMAHFGWQVWGAIKRQDEPKPALVMRTAEKDCWALLLPGGEVIRQHTRKSVPTVDGGYPWTHRVAAPTVKVKAVVIDHEEEQWPSGVGAKHVWEKPNYGRK